MKKLFLHVLQISLSAYFINAQTGYLNDNKMFVKNLKCPTPMENTTICNYVSSGHSRRQENTRQSVHEKNMWLAISRIGCHEELNRLLCSIYSPLCLKSHRTANILPCQEFCTNVHDGCIETMKKFGFLWPSTMDCSRFPLQNESMCIPLESDQAIKCSPCESNLNQRSLQATFCKSNVVLIGQLLQYRNFELKDKIHNIRVSLGPRTKPLRLIKRDGNYTSVTAQNVNFMYDGGDYRRFRRHPFRIRQMNQANHRRVRRSINISDYRKMYESSQTGSRREREENLNSMSMRGATERSDSGNMPRRRINRRIKSVRNRRDSRVFNLDGVTDLRIDCSVCYNLQNLNDIDRWLIMGERERDTDGSLTNLVKVQHLVKLSRENSFLRPFIRYWRNQDSCSEISDKLHE